MWACFWPLQLVRHRYTRYSFTTQFMFPCTSPWLCAYLLLVTEHFSPQCDLQQMSRHYQCCLKITVDGKLFCCTLSFTGYQLVVFECNMLFFLEIVYNGTCSASSDCVTRLSSCLQSKCTCRQDRVYNSTADACDESKIYLPLLLVTFLKVAWKVQKVKWLDVV